MPTVFNPRSPVGGATVLLKQSHDIIRISIHAPRVGSDKSHHLQRFEKLLFQSTLPVWGATPSSLVERLQGIDFNPRSPCGERRIDIQLVALGSQISIHAPRVGSDPINKPDSTFGFQISIHAPRVGSDSIPIPGRREHKVFQSTLPVWGATFRDENFANPLLVFQSTLPVWGATFRGWHTSG